MYSDLAGGYSESPNYSVGDYVDKKTGEREIRYIVVHTTEGTGLSAVNWFLTTKSQVSAHYVIMEDGEVICMVDEDYVAWHAGILVGSPVTDVYDGVNPNEVSIGIEFAGSWLTPLPPQQVSAGAALIRDIWNRRGVMPVVQHAWLSPGNRHDPGDYNYNLVMDEVEEKPMTSEEIYAAIAPLLQARIVAPQADTDNALKAEVQKLWTKVNAQPARAAHTHDIAGKTGAAS